MPFRRFFERGAKRADPEDVAAAPAGSEIEGPPDESVDEDSGEWSEAPPEDAPEIDWRARARAVLPTGASTGSKRAEALYGSADAEGPTHYVQATGCRLVDANGVRYIDCIMALGAVALGYNEPRVQQAAVEAIAAGNIAGLSDVREVEVAERLCQHIPCAEMVQFFKTGAEAVSAAVRLARTYTARDVVVGSGYFGWHDWASDAAGVPAAVRELYRAVPFDDVAALERAVSTAGNRLAAIVIEPIVERMPGEAFLRRARELATSSDAVLVFDEMKTGFRVHAGGYQALAGVTPDLATFGKALANGYPLAAVVGQRDVMEAARRTWISSTLAGESVGLAATNAVLDVHESADVCETLAANGRAMREAVTAAIGAAGIPGIATEGIDQMWLLRFDEPSRETRFLELAARHGVLFKRGAYNYASLAHDEAVAMAIEAAASAALVDLRDEEESRA